MNYIKHINISVGKPSIMQQLIKEALDEVKAEIARDEKLKITRLQEINIAAEILIDYNLAASLSNY